jgi:hypothetical protein
MYTQCQIPSPLHQTLSLACQIPSVLHQRVSLASRQIRSPVGPNSVSRRLTQPSPSPELIQNGLWTAEDDETLRDYRTRGYGWSQIQEKCFPGKSANACRKRHERLMTKRRTLDWDETRLESLAVNYRQMREQIWRPLAERLGEKWEHVEKAVRRCTIDKLSHSANCFSVCNMT